MLLTNDSIKKNCLTGVIARTAAIAFLSVTTSLCLSAQSPVASSGKAVNLKTSLMAPIDLTKPDDLSYSSSTGEEETAMAKDFDLRPAEDQPPPRRRYGRRTNYSDRWHHADGSNKYTFAAGGGFGLPTGSSGKELDLNWKFQVAGGYNFNKKFAVLLQYDYDKFGLTGGNLDRQFLRYNALDLVDDTGALISFAGLDGNAHMWSITLNPMYTYYQGDALGAYVIGGGGFYRKVTNFTLPQTGIYCNPFFGYCYQFTQNQTFDHYSNNAGGVSGGIGFTYRLSRFASQKLYAEARYAWVDNQPSANSVVSYYPENNKRTGYFPVTVGLRW
ncbi:MAG TPA: hypothetical protein VK638_17555 [Edaphobacter sp.]|nr:hypothetical protein [Edaphobacter sp.]